MTISSLRQNNVTPSFWHNTDVAVMSCAHCICTTGNLQYKKNSHWWSFCYLCRNFHFRDLTIVSFMPLLHYIFIWHFQTLKKWTQWGWKPYKRHKDHHYCFFSSWDMPFYILRKPGGGHLGFMLIIKNTQPKYDVIIKKSYSWLLRIAKLHSSLLLSFLRGPNTILNFSTWLYGITRSHSRLSLQTYVRHPLIRLSRYWNYNAVTGIIYTRADPGFEVRGGANGLENLKTGGGGGGGGGSCINYKYFVIYIFQIRYMSNTLFISYLKLHYLDNIVMKNRIWKNFRGGARPPLNPPLIHVGVEVKYE